MEKTCRGELFLKINKRADQNKTVQGEFLLKINKHACTSIRYTRVSTFQPHSLKVKDRSFNRLMQTNDVKKMLFMFNSLWRHKV